ncbi:MAG TPA: hypothetical protein VFF69_13285 [Phycisphaerales bacterium]|nr:hypothetical protein [Phycisphaerales bacterium]
MARLTPAHVNAARTLAAWGVRVAALALLAVGCYLFLKKLLFGLGSGQGLEMTFQVWDNTGEEQSTYRGLAMIAVGAALAAGARRIARWVVSAPETGCPRCGYAGAATDTCPECGLRDMSTG